MATKATPPFKKLRIPKKYLREATEDNINEIKRLAKLLIKYNKDNNFKPRQGIPEKLIIGGKTFNFEKVSETSRSIGSNKVKNVGLKEYIPSNREPSLKIQTATEPGAKRVTYGGERLRRVLKNLFKGQEDHHIRFRTLFEPFFELGDKFTEADQTKLANYFLEVGEPLGNVLENLEGIDKDLHKELHNWAKENQIQVNPFSAKA